MIGVKEFNEMKKVKLEAKGDSKNWDNVIGFINQSVESFKEHIDGGNFNLAMDDCDVIIQNAQHMKNTLRKLNTTVN